MYQIIKPNIGIKEILSLLAINSNAVEDFEKEFAKKIGTKYALAFSYGRSGIYAILKALKIKGEVLTPAYTCIVVQNAAVKAGCKPTFYDASGFNADMKSVKKNFTSKTKVVVPTHIYGYPEDVNKIRKICKNALVIEDACMALGTKVNGKNAGTLGDLAIFSFNVSKQMVTFNGGMVVTNNKEHYDKIKKYRDKNFKNPGLGKYVRTVFLTKSTPFLYWKPVYGFLHKLRRSMPWLASKTEFENWDLASANLPEDTFEKMSKTQAKIGLVQLKKLDETIKHRRQIAKWYNKYLKVKAPIIKGGSYSHYTIRVKNRDNIREKLFEKEVNTGVAMNYSCPHTKYYRKGNDKKFKNSKKLSEEIINLPIHHKLKEKDVKKISRIVNEI